MRLSGEQVEQIAADLLRPNVDAGESRPAGVVPPASPARIGSYRIVRRIGVGGTADVFEASHPDMRRRVAIKVLTRSLPTGQAVHWFRQEIRVLGRLEHPAIARIYDSGALEDDLGERPYFVMEIVSGLPMTEYADRKQLAVRDRLALVAQLCDGVQHAHARGVVHRDLKPANVLVVEPPEGGGGGRVKILDFGVARVTDADLQLTTLHTETDQIIGTIPYMSPEQVSGDSGRLGPATDVYAIGVIMFKLLTGRLPHVFPSRNIADAARIITGDEPAAAGHLCSALRGDLETIIGKALAREPGRRYGVAGELGEDVRRFLDYRPVLARPPTAGYRLRRFLRRHRAAVTSLAAVFVVLVAALLAVSVSLRRSIRAEAEALQTVDALLVLAERLASKVGATDERRQALTLIGEIASEQLARHPRNPQAIDHMGVALTALGDLELESGRPDEARSLFERALDLRRSLVKEHPDDGPYAAALAVNLVRLGNVAKARGDFDEAGHRYAEALCLDEALVDRHPAHAAYLDNLSWSYERVGQLHGEHRGDFATALTFHRRRHEISVRLARLEPTNPLRRAGLASSHHCLGYCAQMLVRPATARAHYEEALALARDLLEVDPDHRLYLHALVAAARGLAASLEDDDVDRRRQLLHEALEACDALLGREPRNPRHLKLSMNIHRRLCELTNDVDDDSRRAARAIVDRARLLVVEDPGSADAQALLAELLVHGSGLLAAGLEERIAILDEAATVLRPLASKATRAVGCRIPLSGALASAAEVALALGRLDEARARIEEGLEVCDEVVAEGAEPAVTLGRRLELLEARASLEARTGESAASERSLAECIALQHRIAALTGSPLDMVQLARMSSEHPQRPFAQEVLAMAMDLVSADGLPASSALGPCVVAWAHHAAGDARGAGNWLDRAMAASPDDPETAELTRREGAALEAALAAAARTR